MARRSVALAVVLACLAAGCVRSVVYYGKSPDRRRRVEVVQRGRSQHVDLDGVRGRDYRAIGVEALAFDPERSRFAYPAQAEDGWHVVVDGREGPAWEAVGALVWSATGGHLAYEALRRSQWRVVRDGIEEPPWDGLMEGALRFSDDGRHLAYVGVRGRKSAAVLDGRAHALHDGIGRLGFAGSSATLVYVMREGERAAVVIDGVAGPEYDAIDELRTAVGSSRVRAAYVALRGSDSILVDGGVESAPAARIESLALSADAAHLAYVLDREDGGGAAVVLDGQALPERYDAIVRTTVAFSSAGSTLAFVARRGAGRFVVTVDVDARDASSGPPFDTITDLALGGADHVAYVAINDRGSFVVVDGRASIPYAWVSDLRLGADGLHWAYLARRGDHEIVAHDADRSAFDFVLTDSLVLSPDGRHWACLVGMRAARQIYVAVDGRPRRPFDLGELTAEILRRPERARLRGTDRALVRGWMAAELALGRGGAVNEPR